MALEIWISAVGTFFAGIGLFLNWHAIREENKTRTAQIFIDSFERIIKVEKSLYTDFDIKSVNQKKEWDSLLFNSIELFAIMVNTKMIKDKPMRTFFDDAIVRWYEEIFLKFHEDEVNEGKMYPEFKKLYHSIKSEQLKK
ncbi:MAG: hypothetical protein ABIJ21_05885 [Nanoarchaeota archaeon]